MADLTRTATLHVWRVRRWRIEVISGPSRGRSFVATDGVVRIGSSERADLVVADPLVSREHLTAELEPGSARIRDVGSKNGTYFGGARVDAAQLPVTGGVVRIGTSELGFFPLDDTLPLAPSSSTRCGRLVGESEAMRLLFAQITRVAESTATVLIHGETGTGKELVAEAIHELGPRGPRPFVVVDCGAIPRDLIESELFGHARGAFTGAVADFSGAFERADGGTLFLDEIGELPIDLQPKLLRALETGQIRGVGRERARQVDVRVIAASLRNLRTAAEEQAFRHDLYYRLAVVELTVPPLRARLGDLPSLTAELCRVAGWSPVDAESLARLARAAWPGNVRQLRNVLARAASLSRGPVLRIGDEDLADQGAASADAIVMALPYKEAKELMVARFTRDYLEQLLARNGGNVSAAAREAGIDRSWIIALARRHGVRARE
ncbi:MAG: sigma 54-dependent Fis family transcriptional regulator [Myxococcales bacterium]|nr:sigma 54-dependent Fis family transcriptional regulator [Myxococcales bacterium]MBK7192810.1 sigma 54-dependent Fis family transcriptional regulator [Myxococcales bacterium]MBP6845862.1 sigma 54-dependent Fis family transcriptional regulator [Kofleriaceae bacterium]